MSYISREKYHVSIRVLHWLMALIILSMIAVGWYMEGLASDAPGRGDLYSLHKSFGVIALVLVFLRLGLRLMLGVPDLPDSIPLIIRKIAHFAHYLIKNNP